MDGITSSDITSPEVGFLNYPSHARGITSSSVNTIPVLITPDWPLLDSLNLSMNDLCEAACQHWTRGAWPQLSSLDGLNLSINNFSEAAGQALN